MIPRDPKTERVSRRKLWRDRKRLRATMAGENKGAGISGLCWSFLFEAQLGRRSSVPDWAKEERKTEYLRRAIRDERRNSSLSRCL
jgi:hypothetical protein